MVMLVLAGSSWQGRYLCSFGGSNADAILLGEALALMTFPLILVALLDRLTTPANKLTIPLTTRLPWLRGMGIAYVGLVCIGAYGFCLATTIGIKLEQSAGGFSKLRGMTMPIIANFGLHFKVAFDPQLPTMNLVVSAKAFQVFITYILSAIQIYAVGDLGAQNYVDYAPFTMEHCEKILALTTDVVNFLKGSSLGV